MIFTQNITYSVPSFCKKLILAKFRTDTDNDAIVFFNIQNLTSKFFLNVLGRLPHLLLWEVVSTVT